MLSRIYILLIGAVMTDILNYICILGCTRAFLSSMKLVHAFVTVLSCNLQHIVAIIMGIMKSRNTDADQDEEMIKNSTFQSPHRSFVHKAPMLMSSCLASVLFSS